MINEISLTSAVLYDYPMVLLLILYDWKRVDVLDNILTAVVFQSFCLILLALGLVWAQVPL